MSERFEALQELIQNPASNPAALGAAVAIIVVLVVVIALVLIVFALPSREPDDTDETDGTELPPRRRSASPFVNALAVWLLAVATLGLGVVIFYESTSNDEYCTQTCHAMAKPAATHAASAHRSITCIRCHEGRKWKTMLGGLASRTRSIYLQYSEAEAGRAKVPEGRCRECHRTAMSLELTARNGELFRHRDLPDNASGCQSCHGNQGHEVQALR